MLDEGVYPTKAALAQGEGVIRAAVTLGLARLRRAADTCRWVSTAPASRPSRPCPPDRGPASESACPASRPVAGLRSMNTDTAPARIPAGMAPREPESGCIPIRSRRSGNSASRSLSGVVWNSPAALTMNARRARHSEVLAGSW